ncbi:MAG TPA: DNA adenine methylase [Gemmatimonadaceae bacterium]|jgi:adenine-specific DNA-methyltransferase|nr:DNA adenine methylase [Gemmatimonadaceae bacterium]
MRYIGNKTRLLPFILRTLKRSGIGVGSVHDAFAGTASVSRALKEKGWRVHSSDLLMSSYVFQRAYVAADSADPLLEDMARELGSTAPHGAFITEHFSPSNGGSGSGRMYFTPENAGRIDAAREELERWRKGGKIDEDSYYLLLAAIIEGADRVANTAGVYASYMKRWQPNAKRRFELVAEAPVKGVQPASAMLMDATDAARAIGEVDLLYIDPPYNARQYVAYYHIPEILARGWTDSVPAIRGKVGLLAGEEGRSQWSHGRRVQRLFSVLLAATGARHALVSFNSEGHLAPDTLQTLLAKASIDGQVAHYTQRYRRYRADSEREGRHHHGDTALEHLYLVRLR